MFLEKAMAPHPSPLAWKIPWMEEPGRLRSMGLLSRTRLSDFTFTFRFSLSHTGEGNGNPLQCSCLENPRDGGAWWAAVYRITQSQTRLKWLSSSSPCFISYWYIHSTLFLMARKDSEQKLQRLTCCPSPGSQRTTGGPSQPEPFPSGRKDLSSLTHFFLWNMCTDTCDCFPF